MEGQDNYERFFLFLFLFVCVCVCFFFFVVGGGAVLPVRTLSTRVNGELVLYVML